MQWKKIQFCENQFCGRFFHVKSSGNSIISSVTYLWYTHTHTHTHTHTTKCQIRVTGQKVEIVAQRSRSRLQRSRLVREGSVPGGSPARSKVHQGSNDTLIITVSITARQLSTWPPVKLVTMLAKHRDCLGDWPRSDVSIIVRIASWSNANTCTAPCVPCTFVPPIRV